MAVPSGFPNVPLRPVHSDGATMTGSATDYLSVGKRIAKNGGPRLNLPSSGGAPAVSLTSPLLRSTRMSHRDWHLNRPLKVQPELSTR